MMQADLFDPKPLEVTVPSSIADAPKIDLHRHLLGSLTCEHVRELVDTHALDVPDWSPAELASLLTITKPVAGLREFFRPWSTLSKLLVSPEVAESIAYMTMRQAHDDKVVYAEFRVSWGMSPNARFNTEEFLHAVEAGFRRAETEFGVIGRIVLGITRHHFSRHTPEIRSWLWSGILRAALRFQNRLVVGFDVSGVEDGYPARIYASELKQAREHGFGITVHSGETTSAAEVRSVVEILRPDRIGHGLAAARDEYLMSLMAEQRIAVEACPTSNWLTGAVTDLKHHPLTILHDRGVPITVNTDNPAICCTTLSREQSIVVQHMGATPEMLTAFTSNTLDFMFAERELRDRLIARWFPSYKHAAAFSLGSETLS